MLIDNNKISNKQIIKILIFEIISVSMITIPVLAAKGAARDGIFAIIIGSLAAYFYGLFFLYMSKKLEGDYIENIKKILGEVGAFIISTLYIIKLLFSCWFTLILFQSVINKTVLPNTDYRIILFTFIFMGCYMAIKGIEVRSRVTEVLFLIVMIPLFFIFLFGLKNIDITNIFPLFMTGSSALVRTSYIVMLMYSPLEFFLFVLPFTGDKDDKIKSKKVNKSIVITVVAVSTVLNTILFILLIGMLGVTDAGIGFDSSIAILKMIELPIGFIKRQDALILMFWMYSVFTIISAYFYYMSKITETVIGRKSRYGYYLFYGILVFFISTIHISPDEAMNYYIKYMSYVGMPQSILIPLLLIAGMLFRGRKNYRRI